MKFADVLWEIVDNGLYLANVVAVVVIGLAAIACPLWLGMIHREIVAIREMIKPCQCSAREDKPCPVLPRVLPRMRRIGEEAED